MKIAGGTAAALTPLALAAQTGTHLSDVQDLFKLLGDPASRTLAAADLMNRAAKDPRLAQELLSFVATERAYAERSKTNSLEFLNFLDKIIWQPLLRLEVAPAGLRNLFVDGRDWPVQRAALHGLAETFRLQQRWTNLQIMPGDFDVFLAASSDLDLADDALFMIKETARKNANQRLTLSGKLLLAYQLANAREDQATTSKIDNTLRESPFAEAENWFAFLESEEMASLADAALGRLALASGLPSQFPDGLSDRVRIALERPETEAVAVQLMQRMTEPDESGVQSLVEQYLVMLQTARVLKVPDVASGLLYNLLDRAPGVQALVHWAHSPYADYLASVEAINVLAQFPERVRLFVGTAYFEEVLNMLEQALEFRDKAPSAESLLQALASNLDDDQKQALAKRRVKVAELNAQRERYLADLRRVIIDPQVELGPNPLNPDTPNWDQYIHDRLKFSLRGEFGDILELLEYEGQPEIRATIVATLGLARRADVLVNDRPNLVAVIQTMENPSSLGPITGDSAEKARQGAAMVLTQARIQNGRLRRYLLETTLRLLAEGVQINAPGVLTENPATRVVQGDAKRNLLSVIMDRADPKDVVAIYASTVDDNIRKQALTQLQGKAALDSLLEAYPQALVRWVEDASRAQRGALAWSLLSAITKPELRETMFELLIVRQPEMFRQPGQSSNLALMLDHLHDGAAIRQTLGILNEHILKSQVAAPLSLGSLATQTVLRSLADPVRGGAASRILAAAPNTPPEARRDILARLMDEAASAQERNDQPAFAYWAALFGSLLGQAGAGPALVSIWKDGTNYRRRLLGLRHLARMDPRLVPSVPGGREALQKALQDEGMAPDAQILLNRINQLRGETPRVHSTIKSEAWSFREHDRYGLFYLGLTLLAVLPSILQGTPLDLEISKVLAHGLMIVAMSIAGIWIVPIAGSRFLGVWAQSISPRLVDLDLEWVDRAETALRHAHPYMRLERNETGGLVPPASGHLADTLWDAEAPRVRLAPWMLSRSSNPLFNLLRSLLLPIVLSHEQRRLKAEGTGKIYAKKALPIILKDLWLLRPRNEILGVAIIAFTMFSSFSLVFWYIIDPLIQQDYRLVLLRLPLILGLIPLQIYPVWVLVHSLARVFVPGRRFIENAPYYSVIPKSMPSGNPWPWVTIQIPVAAENFARVIRPTIEAALTAAAEYQAKGGQANVVVLDDGLMRLAKDIVHQPSAGHLSDWEEAQSHIAGKRQSGQSLTAEEHDFISRLEFYQATSSRLPLFGFTARPAEGRQGAFPKAGNLNHHIELADRMEARLGLAYLDRFRRRAILSDLKSRPGATGGDLGFGEYVYVLDKDSTMPASAIATTLPEFFANPALKVGFVQHRTLPTNMGETWFARMISRLSTNYFRFIIPTLNQGGDPAHLVGHNML